MTISANDNTKLIKDWIRPLQKSLTIETENKFINTLGREKYFSDYLHESLKKLDNLNISEEYLRIFHEFSKKFNEYNKLDENQRKRLIIDTRKNLYKLGKTLEIVSSNNISNNVLLNKADSSLSFDSDISLIKNVGKVYKNKLNELGIFHIRDLINYFPRTYLDYTNRVKIINLKPDNLYTCTANVKRFFIHIGLYEVVLSKIKKFEVFVSPTNLGAPLTPPIFYAFWVGHRVNLAKPSTSNII